MGGHHLTSDQLYEFGGHYSSPVRVLGTIPYEVKMVCVSVERGGACNSLLTSCKSMAVNIVYWPGIYG